MVPFSKPSIGPTTEEESEAFGLLVETQRAASSAVRWIISLGKEFVQCGRRDVSSRLLSSVRVSLNGVDPRLCTGYACLLYFAEKVICTCITY